MRPYSASFSSSLCRTLLSLAALLAFTLVLAPRTGHATPTDVAPNPILIGVWQGTFQSDVTPELQGDVVFENTAQHHRRFVGSLSAGVFFDRRIHFVSERGRDA